MSGSRPKDDLKLPAGKVPSEMLRELLASIPATGPSVILGAAVGEDAAVIDTGGPELLVAKTDPITFAAEDSGRYLLAVNSNDLATTGAEPRWLLVTVLLPEGINRAGVYRIFASVREACAAAAVALVGGHTEITVGLDRPVLVGCLLGTVRRERLVHTSGARAGDAILLAGGIAIEGTAILANEHSAALRTRGVPTEVIERAAGWIRDPGISILRAAQAVHGTGAAHSMHDPTEGGIVTALHELAEAAGAGLCVDRSTIAVLPDCARICAALELDPLGLLASGALLVTLDSAETPAALERLRGAGIPGARIGDMLPASEGRTWTDGTPLPCFATDELARYLEAR